MRGLLLAGGNGTRLSPTTRAVNKHLLPVYDKPLIYYPLCNLILAGAKDISVVSTSVGVKQIQMLLGNSQEKLGISIDYIVQDEPKGISHAINLYCTKARVATPLMVVLGDNFFYGPSLGLDLGSLDNSQKAVCWTQAVEDPSSYGIAIKNTAGKVLEIVEKPTLPKGSDAVTGLYFFPTSLQEYIKDIPISDRGEFEITSLLNKYLNENALDCRELPRSVYWRDAGTPENMLDTAHFVYSIQKRQQIPIGSPEEAAWRKGFISDHQFLNLVRSMPMNEYQNLLESLLK